MKRNSGTERSAPTPAAPAPSKRPRNDRRRPSQPSSEISAVLPPSISSGWSIFCSLPASRLIPFIFASRCRVTEREHYSALVGEASNVLNKLLNFFCLQFLFEFRHLFLALLYDPDHCGVGFFLYFWYTEVVVS